VTPYRKLSVAKPNRFAHAMTLRTDEELVAILRAPEGEWEPDAILAAHDEVEKRQIPLERRDELHEELARVEQKAETPLQTPAKAIAFASGLFMFPGLLIFLIAGHYRKQNELRKARDVVHWFVYGLGTAILGSVAYATC
jgi:hypothetical protein